MFCILICNRVPLGGWKSFDPDKRCLFWMGRMTVSCSSLITSSRPAISLQVTYRKGKEIQTNGYSFIDVVTQWSQLYRPKTKTVAFIVCGSTRWDAIFISYSVSLTPSTPILFISCSAWTHKDREYLLNGQTKYFLLILSHDFSD